MTSCIASCIRVANTQVGFQVLPLVCLKIPTRAVSTGGSPVLHPTINSFKKNKNYNENKKWD
jgi:hypothetical protein